MGLFKKVLPGDDLSIRADTFNSFIDAAKAYKEGRGHVNHMASRRQISGTITVRNVSGSDQDQFAVMALREVIISPSDNSLEFQYNFSFDSDIFSEIIDSPSSIVILQEPIKSGELGSAMIQGISPTKIIVAHEDDHYVTLEDGETKFSSSYDGVGRILYKESGLGTKWAIVSFPVSEGQRICVVNGSGEEIPSGGAMMVTGADSEIPFKFTVNKVDHDHALNIIPLPGVFPLAAGQSRIISFEPLMRFLVTGDVNRGDFIGAQSDAWEFKKGKFGFFVHSVQETLSEKYAYCFFNGSMPVLKAVSDESGGSIDVKAVDSSGSEIGDTITLDVIPE